MCLKEQAHPLLILNHFEMKRIYLFLFFAACILTFISCNKKKESREQQVQEFRSQLTAEDTTIMLQLCDNAMKELKARNINKVLASLYEYTDSTQEVKPLSDKLKKKYTAQFKLFPVLDYKRIYYSFQLEGCNDVKYEVTFATAEQAGTGDPAKTAFMFNPVKINDEWKLCVKTPSEDIDQEYR